MPGAQAGAVAPTAVCSLVGTAHRHIVCDDVTVKELRIFMLDPVGPVDGHAITAGIQHIVD